MKIHSSTSTVSPMFVFYTSNERLFKHFVPAQFSGNGLPLHMPSQVETAGRKRVSPENLEAVRARFFEMLVYKTPKQDPADLEQCGTFERHHFLLGTFNKAMSILEKYSPTDFHSQHLHAYVLSGLAKNLPLMESIMCGHTTATPNYTALTNCAQNHLSRLHNLKAKYNVNF